MRSNAVSFREVLKYAIGGGWGSDTPTEKNTVAVAIIRGTDFGRLSERALGDVPRRFESASKVAKRALEVGDIVLEVSGGSPARGQTTGRTCFIDNRVLAGSATPVIPASFCRLVRVDRRLVLPRFAYFWLQDMYMSGRAGAYENQSTGISNFQFEHFLDAERLELPPLQYQREVVGVLGSIDDRIDNLRQANATLEAIAKALFKSWFVDFDPVRAKAEGREPEGIDAATAALFPGELADSEFGPIPKDWQVTSVGEVAELIKGCSYKGAGLSGTEGAFMFNLGCFNAKRVFATDNIKRYTLGYREKQSVAAGDLIMANTDMTQQRDILGRALLVPTGCEPAFVSHHVFKVAVRRGNADQWRRLLFFAFQQPAFRERAVGHATGTTVLSLARDSAEKCPIIEPDPKVLSAFDATVSPLLAQIENNLGRAKNLQKFRDTLLPRLISGKLRLRDAEAQAEALA